MNIRIKYIFLILIVLLLTGCEDSEYTNKVSSDIQIEISKEFNVPISNVNVKAIEHGGWRFSINKFLINIEGDNKTYMYIGSDYDGYELLVYEEWE